MPHHPRSHVHDAFHHAEAVDWEALAAHQRERIPLADAWWTLLDRPEGRRLADVGCGPGVLAARYAELGAEVLAVDLRADALAHVPHHPRLRTLVHDIEAAPIPEPVDIVVLSDVLHHARHPAQVLRHVRASTTRVLVAEYDPGAPGDVGPPLEARIAPDEMSRLLREAGFMSRPLERPAREQYAIVATRA